MNNIPNLDSLDIGDLEAFYHKYNQPSRNDAAELIGHRCRGYIKVTKLLAQYALYCSTAKALRTKGEMERAIRYDDICQNIYEQIPKKYRW